MGNLTQSTRRECPLTGLTVTLEFAMEVERGCSCSISSRYDSFECSEMQHCAHYRSGAPACLLTVEQTRAIER